MGTELVPSSNRYGTHKHTQSHMNAHIYTSMQVIGISGKESHEFDKTRVRKSIWEGGKKEIM